MKTAGERQIEPAGKAQRVTGIEAAGMDTAGEVHTGIVGFAVFVAAGDSVAKSAQPRDAAIGIEKAEFARLLESDTISVVGAAHRQLIPVGSGAGKPADLT